MCWIRDLGDEHGCSTPIEGGGNADDGPSDDELGMGFGTRLKSNADGQTKISPADGQLTAKFVTMPSDKGEEYDASQVLRAVDKAEPGAFWVVHESLPLRQCLQPVHHRAIVSVGRRQKEEAEDTVVQKRHLWLLVPWFVGHGQDAGQLWPDGLIAEVLEDAETHGSTVLNREADKCLCRSGKAIVIKIE